MVSFWAPRAGSRVWFGGEYLLWWLKKGPLPVPIATKGDINSDFPGAIGQNGTQVILGNSNLDYQAFSGLRISGGSWFSPEQTWGLEASGFVLETRPTRQTVSSDAGGNPAIFVPIKDVNFGEDSFTVSFPGSVAGSLSVSSASRLWGAEANLVRGMYVGNRLQINVLSGFRHVNLEESLEITRVANDFGGLLCSPSDPGFSEAAGSVISTTDSFHARNQFYGGQIGLRAVYTRNSGLFLDMRGKVALGGTHQILDVGGVTTQQQPGLLTATFPAGALATASNSGHFDHNEFSVVPEVEVRLGYQFRDAMRIFVGYNFLYWSNVIRPGDQISRTVDERVTPAACSFIPGFSANVPGPPSFHQTSFWAQGVSFGLQFSF